MEITILFDSDLFHRNVQCIQNRNGHQFKEITKDGVTSRSKLLKISDVLNNIELARIQHSAQVLKYIILSGGENPG